MKRLFMLRKGSKVVKKQFYATKSEAKVARDASGGLKAGFHFNLYLVTYGPDHWRYV